MLTSFNAVGVEYLRASWFSQKLDVSNKSYSTITKVMFESSMVYAEANIKFSPENTVSLYNKLRYSLGKSMTFSVSSNTDNELNNTLDFKLGHMF